MTDKAISPLRQRMIEDMTARHFAEKIQNDYIRYVKNFAAFLSHSPDTASAEDLRLFQLHMVHMIAPGGGLSLDGLRWLACRPGFFLHVCVLSRLFRRLFLEKLLAAFDAGQLQFLAVHADLRRATHSPRFSRRSARPSGSSTPSDRSADPRPCWPIWRATPIASPSPTAG